MTIVMVMVVNGIDDDDDNPAYSTQSNNNDCVNDAHVHKNISKLNLSAPKREKKVDQIMNNTVVGQLGMCC